MSTLSPGRCFAFGCDTRTPPTLLMCREHWQLLPAGQRQEVQAAYTPGQAKNLKLVTPEYRMAAQRARAIVRDLEAA